MSMSRNTSLFHIEEHQRIRVSGVEKHSPSGVLPPPARTDLIKTKSVIGIVFYSYIVLLHLNIKKNSVTCGTISFCSGHTGSWNRNFDVWIDLKLKTRIKSPSAVSHNLHWIASCTKLAPSMLKKLHSNGNSMWEEAINCHGWMIQWQFNFENDSKEFLQNAMKVPWAMAQLDCILKSCWNFWEDLLKAPCALLKHTKTEKLTRKWNSKNWQKLTKIDWAFSRRTNWMNWKCTIEIVKCFSTFQNVSLTRQTKLVKSIKLQPHWLCFVIKNIP